MVINSIQTNIIPSLQLISSFFWMNMCSVADEKPISGKENQFRLINIEELLIRCGRGIFDQM